MPVESSWPFRVVGVLGRGNAGVVLEAELDGERVAVKTIPRTALAEWPDALERLAMEATALRRIGGRGAPAFVGHHGDERVERSWLAMELVEGDVLLDAVRRQPLEGAPLGAFALGLARAIDHVHAAGVIHRDVKPANLLLGPQGPVLIDFGIAFHVGRRAPAEVRRSGSPPWRPPEVARGQQAGPSGDVWGWAKVVAYAATGQVLDGSAAVRPLPRRLQEAAAAALDDNPARRPSAADLVRRLTLGG